MDTPPIEHIEALLIENGQHIALLDTQRMGYRRHLLSKEDFDAILERKKLKIKIRNENINELKCPLCEAVQPQEIIKNVECCECLENFTVLTGPVKVKYISETVVE